MEKTAETAIYQQKSIIFATAFEDKLTIPKIS